MRRLASVGVLAACHTSAPPAQLDASVDTPPPIASNAVLVQHVDLPAADGDAATISFAPTSAGDLVIVVVGLAGTTETHVDAVRGGDLELSPDSGQLWSPCGRTFEIFSQRAVPAGLTSLDVTLTTPATRAISMFEVSGVSAYPLGNVGNYVGDGSPLSDQPQAQASGHDLFLATVWTCGDQLALAPGSPLTALPLTTGTGAAYMITPAAGTYQSGWTFSGDRWYSFVIDYR